MSRSDVMQKLVQTVMSVKAEDTGDVRADAARWVATCMNLIEPQLMAVYIVHDPMGAIQSVHLRKEDAHDSIGNRKGLRVLTWEVQ